MQLSVFSICIAVLLSLVTIKVSCKAPEEKKIPKTLPHYCGVKFRKVWEMCCDHGCRHNAYKRVLGEKLISCLEIIVDLTSKDEYRC